MKRVANPLVEVYQRARKSVISGCKKAQKGYKIHFVAVEKSRKRSGLWFIHVLNTVYLQ